MTSLYWPLCSGMEEILRFHPELVNQPKDDGYTPLHIAAANNYADLVSLIASHVSKFYLIVREGDLVIIKFSHPIEFGMIILRYVYKCIPHFLHVRAKSALSGGGTVY